MEFFLYLLTTYLLLKLWFVFLKGKFGAKIDFDRFYFWALQDRYRAQNFVSCKQAHNTELEVHSR